MSTQVEYSSPGIRKGTLGTPIGIKCKERINIINTLMWKRNNGFFVFLQLYPTHHLSIEIRKKSKKKNKKKMMNPNQKIIINELLRILLMITSMYSHIFPTYSYIQHIHIYIYIYKFIYYII